MRKNATRRIPLTQGKFATVDMIDYEWLMQWQWYAERDRSGYRERWYARRSEHYKGRCVGIRMHREIASMAGLPFARIYDHRNGNGLDNRRENIRPATHRQNTANSRYQTPSQSHQKGVRWREMQGKWEARIVFNRRYHYLGLFEFKQEAAKAYMVAAKRLFGEFAHGG